MVFVPSRQPVIVVGVARARAPFLPDVAAAIPTLLALVCAGLSTGRHLVACGLVLALLVVVALVLGRWATRLGRAILGLPPLVIAVAAVVGGLILGNPPLVVGACFGGVLLALALGSSSASRGAAIHPKRPELFVRRLGDRAIFWGDDGGVRLDLGTSRAYVPFAELVPPRLLQPEALGGDERGVVLVVADRYGDVHSEIVLPPAESAADFLAHVERRGAQSGEPGESDEPERPVPEGMLRKARTLARWRDGLEGLIHAAGGYRAGAHHSAGLLALVNSRRASVDARAAAAYLLARQSPGHLERCLSPRTPPLVLALLAASPDLRHLVPEDAWLDARVYLSAEDLEELGYFRSAVEGPRVEIAPERSDAAAAESEAATEELGEGPAETPEARRRQLP